MDNKKIEFNNEWMYKNYKNEKFLKYWIDNIKDLLENEKYNTDQIMHLYDLTLGEPMYFFTLGLIEHVKKDLK